MPPRPPKTPTFDESQLRRFLSFVMDPAAGSIELRVFHSTFDNSGFVTGAQQYSKTLAGWYDDINHLVVDCKRLQGVSGYITVNPVNHALLGRSYNRLAKAKHTTSDADITKIRWAYIDLDPRRPADISSTDEELSLAVERREDILAAQPAIRRSAIWGKSGNGAWILVRLPDLPNDTAGREKVAKMIDLMAAIYSDEFVEVDVKTKNPGRVMCTPGLMKCKGSNIPGRPWRMATIDGCGDESMQVGKAGVDELAA